MLRLRPYKPCDAQAVVSWLGDERVYQMWCGGGIMDYPLTGEALNAYYRSQENHEGFWAMTAFCQEGPAGQLVMKFTDEEMSCLRLCYILVDPEKRGRGYGKEMVGLAVKFGFEIVKARTLSLGVFEHNLPARRCYEAAGFRLLREEEPKIHTFMGEEWKRLEMVLHR